jgi:uncharacterized protein affecting Mg2+/Co2+ transport
MGDDYLPPHPLLDLTAFPTSVLLAGICSFLPLEDIFHLRLVSLGIKNILHGDGQENLWTMVLQRDFEFSEEDLLVSHGQPPALTLRTTTTSPELNSLSVNSRLLPAESLFDAVKKWKRSSSWYFNGLDMDQLRREIRLTRPVYELPRFIKAIQCGRQPYVCAPHFIRAARIWEMLLQWCQSGSRRSCKDGALAVEEEQRVRDAIANSVVPFGYRFAEDALAVKLTTGSMAIHALSAFSIGQRRDFEQTSGLDGDVFCGILGGYEVYSYYRSQFLFFARDIPLAMNPTRHDLWNGAVRLNSKTGGLYLHNVDHYRPVRLEGRENRHDELLLWLEEYVRRLTEGEIGVGIMGSRPDSPKGITLFPRYVPGMVSKSVNDVPVVSRKVTRGVEVIASAVFVPQKQREFGFIYSIRIRLLNPDDDGDEYVSPTDRGFDTCQLISRHWEIVNYETGQTQTVDGEGVIGMKPILKETGYQEQETEYRGTFQYQSCTGNLIHGKFGGYLTFEARSGNERALRFDAEVAFFALDSEPDFLF